ncbi:glycosyltransferase [Clostridium saudiense]|uniref:glycosyltransferase n=1 Tax=Clostridium saudiense TaxID=1414720 RepID=UPI0018AAD653|nr:glycosyltransferase family 2 protein [Clostridium saudiense]
MKVSIVCPLYNASEYIENLNSNILRQDMSEIDELDIIYILTKSKDNSKELLDENELNYVEIDSSEFSHSLTREKFGKRLECDILVFISQDIIMKDNKWLINLVRPIMTEEVQASFSRQICKYENIEKYTRENNYPDESRVVSKKDIDQYGLLTFFYSDASSAIRKSVYDELNAYDNKDLIINEDMYIAHKIILSGYKIKYCADSQVYHSHDFTLKQLYQRYFDTGVFFSQNSKLKDYGSNESGFSLAKYVFKRAKQDRNIKVLFNILPNFGARFIGKVLGEHYQKLPKKFVINSSSASYYWKRKEKEF